VSEHFQSSSAVSREKEEKKAREKRKIDD